MIKFSNDIPIYLQISDLILKDIISGKYQSGEQIPSVRDLSKIYSANPNTCQKAVSELTEKGLLITFSTNGKFVTQDKDLIQNYKKEILDELVSKFWEEISALGFLKSEIIEIMKKEEGKEHGNY